MNARAKQLTLSCAAAASIIAGCRHRDAVSLSLDFSSRQQWRYILQADIRGCLQSAQEGRQRPFSSSARCILLGNAAMRDPAVLHVSVCSVSIATPLLSEAEKRNLIAQCEASAFTYRPDRGSIAPDDSNNIPMVKIGEWDLYKDAAKVMPSLPRAEVRVGSTWDRETGIPLETSAGSARGRLFQSFIVDGITTNSSGQKHATLRWTFTYAVESAPGDTTAHFEQLPSSAEGSGNARINCTEKVLEQASMHMRVRPSRKGTLRIAWEEDVHCSLQEQTTCADR